jgi:predicted transcriptional regulator
MVEERAPARRRRLGAHGMMFRRRRIFARLREGFTYEEIANEEGVTITRIRQIVSAELQQRSVDSGAEHAKLQLDRLASVMQLAAEAVAAGDVTAITPYLKVLDRLDRYQTVASANEVYDNEARKKLMDKINRLADNLGVNEAFAAAVQEHLKKTGQLRRRGARPAGGRPRSRLAPQCRARGRALADSSRPESNAASVRSMVGDGDSTDKERRFLERCRFHDAAPHQSSRLAY